MLLPVVVFRALFFVFGLRSYLPYQIVIVALHVTTAWLLRAVMRRGGVRPFTATGGRVAVPLLRVGFANILQAFQITFVARSRSASCNCFSPTTTVRSTAAGLVGLAAGFAAIACPASG